MNIDIETVSPSRIKLSCAVPPEEAQVEREKIIRRFATTRTISGFRKGKAPRAKIEQAFAGDIAIESMNAIVNTYYRKAVEEKALKVYELIEFTDAHPSDDGGVVFTALLDLEPEFELPQFEGIPVDDVDTVVTEEKIEEDLLSFRKSLAKFEDFTSETVAEIDDMLNISFSGSIEGVPLAEAIPEASAYATKETSWCTVGSKYYLIPSMSDVLVGTKLGTEGSLTAVFPDDFYIEALRGKMVHYAFTVNEGRKMTIPELDEAFLKRLNVENVEALKERVRETLEREAKKEDAERRIRQIVDFLVKSTPFELPQAEFERTTEASLNTLIQYSMRHGAAKEALAAEREKFVETARATSDTRMRASFVIGRIGEVLDVKLSNADFNNYLNDRFVRERLSEAQINTIIKDRDRLRMLHSEALREKILHLILEKAQPTGGIGA